RRCARWARCRRTSRRTGAADHPPVPRRRALARRHENPARGPLAPSRPDRRTTDVWRTIPPTPRRQRQVPAPACARRRSCCGRWTAEPWSLLSPPCRLGRGLLIQESGQAVEPALPLRPVLRDPPLGAFQAPRLEAAGTDTPDLLGSNDAAVLEDV